MSWWQRRLWLPLAAAVALVLAGSGIVAQTPVNKGIDAKQADDEDFARLVREWTTRPEFLSPLVDHLPKVSGVPSPKDILGYYVGAPKKLTRVAALGRYYRALAAASKRAMILPPASPDEGRESIV